MDALLPGGALVDQGLVQPDLGASLEHVRRRDPRLGQPTPHEQVAEVASVSPVGLGVAFVAPQRAGVGRLGQVRGDLGQPEFLNDIPPAGTALQANAACWPANRSSQPRRCSRLARASWPCRVWPVSVSIQS
jgi:hypothetical protein